MSQTFSPFSDGYETNLSLSSTFCRIHSITMRLVGACSIALAWVTMANAALAGSKRRGRAADHLVRGGQATTLAPGEDFGVVQATRVRVRESRLKTLADVGKSALSTTRDFIRDHKVAVAGAVAIGAVAVLAAPVVSEIQLELAAHAAVERVKIAIGSVVQAKAALCGLFRMYTEYGKWPPPPQPLSSDDCPETSPALERLIQQYLDAFVEALDPMEAASSTWTMEAFDVYLREGYWPTIRSSIARRLR